ncbi:Plasmid segregation centromere-binding protein ParR, partial [Dysosmobacter welbionis]
ILGKSRLHGRVVADCQNTHPGVSGGHVGERIGVGLCTIRIKEGRFVDEQHSKLDAGAAGFYVREAQRDRKSDFHLLAAAVREIRTVRSGDTGNPDLQAV